MEYFVEMTPRQVFGLLQILTRSDLVRFYEQILSYRIAGQTEIPTLNEFLSLSLGESPDAPKAFDEKTDRFLEEQALKRLMERRKDV